MPSPIGHSLSGFLVYLLHQKPKRLYSNKEWKTLFPYLLFATLPDLDFFVLKGGRIIISDELHHTYSHSIGFAIGTGVVVYLIRKGLRLGKARTQAFLATLLVTLHAFLDLTTATLHEYSSEGMQILLPFTERKFSNPFVLLPGISIYKSPLHPDNLIGVASEVLLFGFLIGAAWLWNRRLSRRG